MTKASDVDREAAEWIARRDASGGAPDCERQFHEWISRDARHRAAYLRLNAAWEKTAIAERLRPLDGSVSRHLLAPRPEQGRVHRRPRQMLLAAAVAALCAGLLAWVLLSRAGEKTYSTGIGSVERILLEDGSVIDLNADSEIGVRITGAHRRISMRRGEARFKVAHDARRPFDVLGGGRKVRAVGTEFLVRLTDSGRAEVLVTEGRVIIAPMQGDGAKAPEQAPLVVAGEMARVESNRFIVRRVSPNAVASRVAWTEGKIILDYEPLADAVAQFNRYGGVRMVVTDPALRDIRVGGTFEARDVQSFLAALDRVFGIRAERREGGVVDLVRAAEFAGAAAGDLN